MQKNYAQEKKMQKWFEVFKGHLQTRAQFMS